MPKPNGNEMDWIRNNSVGEKHFQTEKIFSKQFSVALINSVLTIYINKKKKKSDLSSLLNKCVAKIGDKIFIFYL